MENRCQHSDADKLAPGICINCMEPGACCWAFIAFAAVFVLGQMVRAYPFFVELAARILA